MKLGEVALEELMEELEAMLKVCFEGEAKRLDGCLELKLPNGQKFIIQCRQS